MDLAQEIPRSIASSYPGACSTGTLASVPRSWGVRAPNITIHGRALRFFCCASRRVQPERKEEEASQSGRRDYSASEGKKKRNKRNCWPAVDSRVKTRRDLHSARLAASGQKGETKERAEKKRGRRIELSHTYVCKYPCMLNTKAIDPCNF